MTCCNACLKDKINCLQDGDELTLNIGGLLDNEDYKAVFTDNQGKSYIIPFTYNGTEKTALIPIGNDDNELPPALFNPFIGIISIEIWDENNECVEFNLYVKTKCVELEVMDAVVASAYAKKDIGLEIPA